MAEEGEIRVAQGAEARLYATSFLGKPAIVKERFKKLYRHPVLDDRLTRERLGLEARNLVRARKAGVLAPLPYQVDLQKSRIVMERIHGVTVKQWLLSSPSAAAYSLVARAIGRGIALLHASGMVHGDLTTSNLMLQGVPHPEAPVGQSEPAFLGMQPLPAECIQQAEMAFASASQHDVQSPSSATSGTLVHGDPPLPYPLVFIDFGLSSTNASVEDKGVDLYVLERAVGSTHAGVAETVFASVLEGYSGAPPGTPAAKEAEVVLAKFQQVRMRGRKRLAFG